MTPISADIARVVLLGHLYDVKPVVVGDELVLELDWVTYKAPLPEVAEVPC